MAEVKAVAGSSQAHRAGAGIADDAMSIASGASSNITSGSKRRRQFAHPSSRVSDATGRKNAVSFDPSSLNFGQQQLIHAQALGAGAQDFIEKLRGVTASRKRSAILGAALNAIANKEGTKNGSQLGFIPNLCDAELDQPQKNLLQNVVHSSTALHRASSAIEDAIFQRRASREMLAITTSAQQAPAEAARQLHACSGNLQKKLQRANRVLAKSGANADGCSRQESVKVIEQTAALQAMSASAGVQRHGAQNPEQDGVRQISPHPLSLQGGRYQRVQPMANFKWRQAAVDAYGEEFVAKLEGQGVDEGGEYRESDSDSSSYFSSSNDGDMIAGMLDSDEDEEDVDDADGDDDDLLLDTLAQEDEQGPDEDNSNNKDGSEDDYDSLDGSSSDSNDEGSDSASDEGDSDDGMVSGNDSGSD